MKEHGRVNGSNRIVLLARTTGRLGVADNAGRGSRSGFSEYESSSRDLVAGPATEMA